MFTFEETTVPVSGRGRPRIESQHKAIVESLHADRKTKPAKTLTAKTSNAEEAKALAIDLKRVKTIDGVDVTVSVHISDDNAVTFWVSDTVKRGPRKPKTETAETTTDAPAKPTRKTGATK